MLNVEKLLSLEKKMNKFLWMRDGVPTVITSVMTIYVREDYDPKKDTFFRIGNEVKISIKLDDIVKRAHK
jgi:hypothetical protein